MSSKITIDELEKYLWGSAVLLRTHVDAGAYKQYIFPLLFFKRLSDVYDEECAKIKAEYGEEALDWEENHQFQIPEGAHWNDVRNVSENVGTAIVEAFHKIEAANAETLQGIFGEASWTNKNRLPDRLLKDMLEHFSSKTLSIENCPADELGQGYEYLIKQFADDSGHTAQEFYTNRTVVNLMTEILKPQSGESIYDPTCGSAGMLISSVAYLKQQGKEWRNLSIYGQEIVTLTSTIARMNLLLHGIQDFNITNADTLKNPAFIVNGQLQRFNVIFANPPYSIKQWDRTAFESDKYGRNKYGVPPQSRADFAFIQHIIASLDSNNGRAAILLPHGVLNRTEEMDIRRKIVESDCIEAVIGLGRHLFYNSGLESCILVLNTNKSSNRKHKILFIEAEKHQHKVQSQSFLFEEDIQVILNAYESDKDIDGLSKHVKLSDILVNGGNLNIKSYVAQNDEIQEYDVEDSLEDVIQASQNVHSSINKLSENNDEDTSIFLGCYALKNSINMTSWKKVKLGDVAEEYSVRVNNPSESEYEWYIGSDCIDGFDFRIKRKTPTEKIKSAQKEFRSGDYLLVRRSLYGSDFRERAPRADFDGVCSADILTIREKKGVIAEGYLINILYSKELWKFIVANSTGSLTRRIKWSQLKDFEFYIPPYEEQEKISALLWSVYEAKTSYQDLLGQIDQLVKSQFIERFEGKKCKKDLLKNLFDLQMGKTPARAEKRLWQSDDYKWVSIADMSSYEKFTEDTKEYLSEIAVTETGIKVVPKNTVIMSFKLTIGRTAITSEDIYTNEAIMAFIPKEEVFDTNYLRFALQFFDWAGAVQNAVKGATLNKAIIGDTEFKVPSMEDQREFNEFAEQSDKSKFELKTAIEATDNLIHAILNMCCKEV